MNSNIKLRLNIRSYHVGVKEYFADFYFIYFLKLYAFSEIINFKRKNRLFL